MTQLMIVRKVDGSGFTITDPVKGVSEDILVPSIVADGAQESSGHAEFLMVPEGIDISSRYHYLAN